ncbi:hypothetical protein [Sphingorhabdus sp. SMR4y]|nr:hypothetical protein [Sphingorhabdus sp. SMR4y]ASK89770.1 hypothetical protein SPHFLASMR4Y_03037 [Sphingorhabdus sp. SMR4y]
MNAAVQDKREGEKKPYAKPELIQLSEIHEKTDALLTSLFRAS